MILFFTESCSHVWLAQQTFRVAHSCDESPRFPWSFCCLVNSAGIPSTVLFFWILRKLSCPWYVCCCDQQRWNLVNMREHLNVPEHLQFLYPFLLCVSQSAFGPIQRRLACACASVNTHQSRSAVKICVAQFLRILCLFLSIKGAISFCVVAIYGHVSLIVDQLDWQSCRSPCCTVVEWSCDHW